LGNSGLHRYFFVISIKAQQEQPEHSHQLLLIWEKYNGSRQLVLFAMVDDVDTPKAQFCTRGVDLESGASGFDVCKLAAVDHSQIYFLALQVDP
jgi:hypothetical protein